MSGQPQAWLKRAIQWIGALRIRAGLMLVAASLAVSACAQAPSVAGSAVPANQTAAVVSPASEAETAQAAQQLLSTYRLRAGDVISIRVFGEDDFTRDKVRLNDAGTVSFPILGEIPVLGRTVSEVEQVITGQLKGRFLVNPRVSVWIEEYRPIFVNGFVERPGAYPFQPGLNVRKAVSLAGGFKERASMNKIFVVKEGDAKQQPVKVDVNSVIAPGDTIFVEESFF